MRTRRWLLSFILIGLTIASAYLLLLLFKRSASLLPEVGVVPELSSQGEKEEWMGVYLKGRKVGWVVSLTDELEDGYHIVERSNLTLKVMGTNQVVKTLTECYADPDYALRSFSFQISSGEHILRVRGEIEEEKLKYELSSGGVTSRSEIPLSEGAYIPVSMEAIAKKRGLVEGAVHSFDIFEPTTQSLTRVEVKVGGKEELLLGGKAQQATTILVSFLGTEATIWVAQDGSVLKEKSPLGLTMVRETREEATRLEPSGERVEILTLYSIPSNVEIPAPRRVSSLRVRLSGVDLHSLELEDERQTLSGDTLSIEVSPLSPEEGQRAEDLEEDLASTPLVQAAHPKIKATADRIVAREDPPRVKLKKVSDWVYRNLEKRATISIPSAIEILKTREGDCNEHAVLFTALARASGLPARICAGVVYLNGVFSYHAWSKVWVGEWIAVDPTFGQLRADATHMKLAEGGMEDLLDLVAVIGELKIEVLEYQLTEQ